MERNIKSVESVKKTFSSVIDKYKERTDALAEKSKYSKELSEAIKELKDFEKKVDTLIPELRKKIMTLDAVVRAEKDLNSLRVTYDLAKEDSDGDMYSEKYRAQILSDGPKQIKDRESKLAELLS